MQSVVIYLIAQSVVTEHGGFERKTQTERRVYAEVLSVTRAEFYQAAAAGIKADCVFRLRAGEYRGEEQLRRGEARYAVVRSYCADGEWTELTARRIA